MSENLFGLTVAADKGLDDLQCQRLNRRRKSAYPLCSGGLKTAPKSTLICALIPNLRKEYHHKGKLARIPVHEVMGLSPISLDPFLNGVPCPQFRGTRFRATWLLDRQILHGFHLPCREEEKRISIKKKADV